MTAFEGVFEPLKDPGFFSQVRVDPEAGTMVWPNGAALPVAGFLGRFPSRGYNGRLVQTLTRETFLRGGRTVRHAIAVLLLALLATACLLADAAGPAGAAAPAGAAGPAGTAVAVGAAAPAGATGPAQSPEPTTSSPSLSPSGDLAGASPAASHDILVSRQLAEARGLGVGDVVSLTTDPSGAGTAPFRVAGVYEPIADPMKLTAKRWEVRLHLPALIAMTADPADPLSRESVDAINIALRDPEDAERFIQDLGARMPGLAAAPTRRPPEGNDPFAVLDRFHFAIAIITVIGSSAFLMALMVMRTEERRETVGILRLIGLSRRRILAEVLLEGLLIAACGALFGILFAAATQGAVNRIFQWRYDTVLVFVHVTPTIAARSVAVSIPLGVLAGLVASWTLLRTDIGALLRR